MEGILILYCSKIIFVGDLKTEKNLLPELNISNLKQRFEIISYKFVSYFNRKCDLDRQRLDVVIFYLEAWNRARHLRFITKEKVKNMKHYAGRNCIPNPLFQNRLH